MTDPVCGLCGHDVVMKSIPNNSLHGSMNRNPDHRVASHCSNLECVYHDPTRTGLGWTADRPTT